MNIIILLLLIAALVCFGVAFILPPQSRFLALGAAFITITLIIARVAVVLLCFALMGCQNGKYVGPQIQGKVCVTENGTRYCVGSDGEIILLDADFKSVK